MNVKQSLQLVMACDESYAMPLATTLRSVVETNRQHWPITVYILFDRFSDDAQKKVQESVPKGSLAIRWMLVDLIPFQGFSSFLSYSKITYARLLIPWALPPGTSKLLYLDSDILVLGDLGPLWETDLENATLGAVVDVLDEISKRGGADAHDLPRVMDYFNSGVLLIDLDRWRAEKISERTMDYLRENPDCRFPDQDALNVVCDGVWKKLDPQWNFQGHCDTCLWEVRPERRPKIVHFVTAMKPWIFNVPTLNTSFYDTFRNRTRFARSVRERMNDLFQGGFRNGWTLVKFGLKRYSIVRAIWNHLQPRRGREFPPRSSM